MQEKASSPSQERPVDRRDGTSEERPLPFTKVGDGRVGVVQICEHHNPVVRQLYVMDKDKLSRTTTRIERTM